MEEILIISNYYPPEKGAAANRMEQLAFKLQENNYCVTVLCPLGNYPKGKLFPEYRGKFTVKETLNHIKVKRLWIYPSNSKNIFKRILSTLSFSISLSFYLTFKKTPIKIIIQSPPLLLSFTSILVLSFKQKKIILNVSDLWPLAAVELNVLKSNSFSHKTSLILERYIYNKASVILGQSYEILAHIKKQFPQKKYYLYRNFPNHQLADFKFSNNENRPIKLFYAGLLGVAQGVLDICKKINLKNINIEFHIFGEGTEKIEIENFIKNDPSKKIFFHGMLERNDLISKLSSFDIALVPLKTRIYGSVPSKIFEYSSLGIPILYFGGGEGETIVQENNLGWIATVENFDQLNEKIIEISQIDKANLQLLKKDILKRYNINFNLDVQIRNLIEKGVF